MYRRHHSHPGMEQGVAGRPRSGVNQRLNTILATLTLLKVAELRILLEHLGLSKSGVKQELVLRITRACATSPQLIKPVVDYITRRELTFYSNTPAHGNRRAHPVRRSVSSYSGQTYSHPQYRQPRSYPTMPAVPPRAAAPSRPKVTEMHRVAAEYLDILAIRDPFAEKVATVLRVAIFKMPELYQKFEVSETLMSLIRSGMTCRLSCLMLTSSLDRKLVKHSWPTNAKLYINNSPLQLIQKQTQDGKVKTKAVQERPASIHALVLQGVNTFRLTAEPNQEHGDWPFGICITIVRPRKLSELMDKMRAKNTLPLDVTLTKIKNLYHEDSDIVTEKLSVSLKDPLTMQRIKIPARGRFCNHLGCFDLETFLKYQREAKNAQWKCVLCYTGPLTLKQIVVDKWMEEILDHCKDLSSVHKVDVFEDGKYTPVFSQEDSTENDDDGEGNPLKRKYDNIKEEQGLLETSATSTSTFQRQASEQSLGTNYDDAIELE